MAETVSLFRELDSFARSHLYPARRGRLAKVPNRAVLGGISCLWEQVAFSEVSFALDRK